MPTDLNTSIEFLKTRVDKTRSVQTQIAATWLWELKTVAQWNTDSAALDTTEEGSMSQVGVEAHTLAEAARGVLDTRLDTIHKQTVAGVGVMRVRAERNPEIRDVVDELSSRGDSRKEIEDEGMAMLSAWKLVFGGPAFTPAPGMTFAGFRELFKGRAADTTVTPIIPAVPSLRELKEEYSDRKTLDRRENGRLSKKLALIERDVVDWYAEATKVFAEGTEIGDLIRSQVPTGTDYNPPTPHTPAPPSTPAPNP